jgi:hypothetical protein
MATITRLRADAGYYCAYDALSNTATAICYLSNVSQGDTITVKLVRQDGYGPVQNVTSAPLAAGQTVVRLPFPLQNSIDSDGIYRARAGQYVFTDYTSGTAGLSSAPFTLTIASLRRFRQEICRGLPLLTGETVGPLTPFSQLTGVTVAQVKENLFPQPYSFSYAHTAGTLSWGNGPAQVVSGGGEFTLIDGTGNWWLVVEVDDSLLPTQDVSETIPFDVLRFSDAMLAAELAAAQHEVEDYLQIYLEPTQLTTPNMAASMADPTQAATYAGISTFYDQLSLPVNYYRPDNDHNWLTVALPVRGLIKLEMLAGFTNQTEVIQLDKNWWQWDEKSGLVQLVPNQGVAISWLYYTGFFYAFLIGAYDYVPGFWNWKATVGLRNLRDRHANVLQLVEYTAAVKVLRQAALHARPGYVNESLARDGVSQQIAYGAGKGGIYAQTIEAYEAWIKENRSDIRQRLIGPKMKLIS